MPSSSLEEILVRENLEGEEEIEEAEVQVEAVGDSQEDENTALHCQPLVSSCLFVRSSVCYLVLIFTYAK